MHTWSICHEIIVVFFSIVDIVVHLPILFGVSSLPLINRDIVWRTGMFARGISYDQYSTTNAMQWIILAGYDDIKLSVADTAITTITKPFLYSMICVDYYRILKPDLGLKCFMRLPSFALTGSPDDYFVILPNLAVCCFVPQILATICLT